MMNGEFQKQFASEFAEEWVAAWNSHDLERILGHYATNIELTSMFVPRVLGIAANTVRGIGMLRLYFSEALAGFPDLKFVPRAVYSGIDSLVVEYKSVGGLWAAEMMGLNERGLIWRVHAHYCESTGEGEIREEETPNPKSQIAKQSQTAKSLIIRDQAQPGQFCLCRHQETPAQFKEMPRRM